MTAIARHRIVCTQCDGRQLTWHADVLWPCDGCDGTGWQSLPKAVLDPRLIVTAALVLGAVFLALPIAIAVLS